MGPGHHVYPDARGFGYLAAVVDWFSRRVLAWRVSITMEAAFCLEAVTETLARLGKPEIFDTEQSSQFTSGDLTGLLLKHNIAISMDGGGVNGMRQPLIQTGMLFRRPRPTLFPNEAAITRLIGALPLEQNDEWPVQRTRYMTLETIAPLSDDTAVGLHVIAV